MYRRTCEEGWGGTSVLQIAQQTNCNTRKGNSHLTSDVAAVVVVAVVAVYYPIDVSYGLLEQQELHGKRNSGPFGYALVVL